MQKFINSFAFAVLAVALSTTQAMAGGESNCQIIYGGGQICNTSVKFTINKLVATPSTNNYVDNLNVNDPRYGATQTVNFKIVITNTGSADLKNVNVIDTFPQYIDFVSGTGNYNQSTKQLTFSIDSLAKGASKEFIVTGKVADEGQLPANSGITCVTNNVRAIDASGAVADDASQVCIEKTVITSMPAAQIFQKVPVKNIPNTGPEMLPLLGLIPAGLAGIKLRKLSK